MSIDHLTIPNFRLPKRLVSWMQENGVRERVPSAEKVFFKENLDVRDRASGLVAYARQVIGLTLTPEMEDVLCESPDACVRYAEIRRDVSEKIINACGQDPIHVYKLATALNRRLPQFEDKIQHPEDYVKYAQGVGQRIPEIEDRVLFAPELDSKVLSRAVLDLVFHLSSSSGYGQSSIEGPLQDERIKEILKKDKESVLELMRWISMRGSKLPSEFHYVFAGSGACLSSLSEHLRCRLPLDLELTWQGSPRELVNYARRWVRGRLPESMESVLFADKKAAVDYAFEVVRGFASPRLSDPLHNFLSISEADENIRRYVAECKRVDEYEKNYSGSNDL